MNIEDGGRSTAGRGEGEGVGQTSVDGRLPLWGGKGRWVWWLKIGPGGRRDGCRACKHPGNDWPNRNLHNTWRSATRLSPSPFFAHLRATLGESIPRSPSNRRTFSA